MESRALKNCSKCGLCLSVCPVYKIALQEQASPRARLQLIKLYEKKELVSSAGLKEIISKCLMCGSCAEICPSGINHYSKFMEMRKKMAMAHGEGVAIKSLIYLLSNEFRLNFSAGFAKLGQRVIPETFLKKYNLGNIPLEQMPEFNKKPFRQAASDIIRRDKKIKGSVLYFTGCATNYLFDKTGFATIKILQRLGYEVIIPDTQTCCGIPMLFHGAEKRAEKNILTNIRCLNPDNFNHGNIRAIIVDCPTCGSALKNEYPALKKNFDSKAAETVDKISVKVIDILSFILKESGSSDLMGTLMSLKSETAGKETVSQKKQKVTYHLPCHLKNSLKAPCSSETILKAMPEIEYVRAADADECCGGGGTFFYEYPEVSGKIVNEKIENAQKTGAGIWLTDCPVCRINLSGNLKKNDNITVKHPVEMF